MSRLLALTSSLVPAAATGCGLEQVELVRPPPLTRSPSSATRAGSEEQSPEAQVSAESGPASVLGTPHNPTGSMLGSLSPAGEDRTLSAPAAGRRLTRVEVQNAIADIFGVELGLQPRALLSEPDAKGLRNNVSNLVPSGPRIAAYNEAASLVAAQVTSERLLSYTPCVNQAFRCRAAFVRTLGHLVFRRPLYAPEEQRLLRLFEAAEHEGGDFELGARLLVRAMLQAPQFLYRLEQVRQDGLLDPNALASRLSFLVWASSPDLPLLAAAQAGSLHTVEGRREQLERMTSDPRAKRGIRSFAEEWLKLYRLDTASRSPERYPEFSRKLIVEMKRETLTAIERVFLGSDQAYREIFLSETTEITPSLARIYDLPLRSSELATYDLTRAQQRVGVLTQPAILSVMASSEHASIVDRGLYILRSLLCRDVPSPPEAVAALFPDEVPQDVTDRERFAVHNTDPICASCHTAFEPLGYAFEPFDALGRFREQDRYGNELRSSGELTLDGQLHGFANTKEFVRTLAQSPSLDHCFVQRMFEYSHGRSVARSDDDDIRALRQALAAGENSFGALLSTIVELPSFGAIATDAPMSPQSERDQ